MTTNPRHYTLLALGLAAGIIGTIVAVNLAVDPYNYFGWNRLGVYISAERESKSKLVLGDEYDAMLVGDSKPAMVSVSHLEGYRFFNGAFGGCTTREMLQFVDRFAHDMDLVLIGLDACKHDPVAESPDPFVPWRTGDIIDKTLSIRTLEYSIRTIRDFLTGATPHMSKDGSFLADRWFELYDIEDPARARVQIDKTSRHYENYVFPGPQSLESLRSLRSILDQRGIRNVVFIPPLHEEVARRFKQSPGYEGFNEWKSELTSIFPAVLDFSCSEWSDASNFFRIDPVHFKPMVGVELINREILPQVNSLPSPVNETELTD